MTKINPLDLFRHKHDIKYTSDEDWGKCTKCGKLFCHPALWWYATAVMREYKQFRQSELEREYLLYKSLNPLGGQPIEYKI